MPGAVRRLGKLTGMASAIHSPLEISVGDLVIGLRGLSSSMPFEDERIGRLAMNGQRAFVKAHVMATSRAQSAAQLHLEEIQRLPPPHLRAGRKSPSTDKT